MKELKKITSVIAGIDFSENSIAALEQAITIACWHHAKLHLVHIISEDTIKELDQFEHFSAEEITQRSYAMIRGIIDDIVDDDKLKEIDLNIDVSVGDPIKKMQGKVIAVGAELVVLGVHGATSEGKEIGAFVTQCIRQLPAEVMVINEDSRNAYQNIVACIDFSDNSPYIVEQAIHLAYRDMAKLHFIHVYTEPWESLNSLYPNDEAPVSIADGYRDSMENLPQNEVQPFQDHLRNVQLRSRVPSNYASDYREKLEEDMNKLLKPFEENLKHLDSTRRLINNSNHGEGILNDIDEQNIDMVVLGTHGQRGILGPFLGNTAERLLRNHPCSLLTIKPEATEQALKG